MNLDLAIQNTIKRSPMENAMHGVISNLGQSFELHAIHNTVRSAEQIMGQKVGVAHTNPLAKPTATNQKVAWIDGVHHADTMVPAPITMSSNDILRNSPKSYPFEAPIGTNAIPQVKGLGKINLSQRRKF